MGKEELVIGICDDDLADVKRIAQEIRRCVTALGKEKPVIIICQSGKNLLENFQKYKVKLIFLDLEMPEWNGFDLARQLYVLSPEIKIIFVSNHENMVFDSYEYAPLWFVRKSSLERDMMKALQKYFQIVTKVQVNCKGQEGQYALWINTDDVVYIECSSHTLLMNMANSDCHQLYGSLKLLEETFTTYGFVRVHKNYLVNAKYVKEVRNRTVQLQNGIELDIGKNRRKEIVQLVEACQKGRRLY